MGFILPSLWLELLLVTLLCIVVFFCKDFNYWKKRNVPFVSPLSWYGNILPIVTLRKSVNQYLDVLHKESIRLNSKYLGFWIAEKPSLYFSDPEIIKKILVDDFEYYFNDRLVGLNAHGDSLGKSSVFLMKQNHSKNMRIRLETLFTSDKIKKNEKIVSKNSNSMLEFIDQHNKFTGKQPLNCRELVARFAADNIVEIYLGLIGQCLKDMPGKSMVQHDKSIPKFNDIGNSLTGISVHRALEFASFFIIPEITSFLRFEFFSHEISNFFRELYQTAKNQRRVKNARNPDKLKDDQKNFKDLLDMLIYFEDEKVEVDGMKYEGDVLPAQIAIMFIAGFESSSSSMSFFLATMTQYPEIQDRIRQEIKTVIAKHGDLTYESLSELKYLDMAYKEILRLYPTLPMLDRICTRKYKLEDSSLVVEKGTKVFISLTGIQLDPRYWENPHKFDPERFSPANISSIVPFTYIPLGEGPKICIGEEFASFNSKMGLATILSKYRVRGDGTLKTVKDLKPNESYETLRIPIVNRGMILNPKNPPTMYFEYMPVEQI